MNELSGVLRDLFLIFFLARAAAEIFKRARLPVVVGELLVGLLIGPHAAHLIDAPSGQLVDLFGSHETAQAGLDLIYDVIGQLGLIVLLFYIGLETPFERLLSVLPRALAVAVPGAALTMTVGTVFILVLHEPLREALFVGAALAPTSVAITVRVLKGYEALQTLPGQVILGAAVVDDVLGLLVLVLVSEFARNGGIDAAAVSLIALQAVGFFVFMGLAARNLIGRYSLHLEKLRIELAPLTFAILMMLGFSALAAQIGLAGVVGAFLAGIVLADSRERLELDTQIRPIYEFLAPFFFVFTGAKVDLGIFQDAHVVWLFLGITGLAFAGKIVGCGLGSLGLGLRSMAIVAVGMIPRGEIGFAVASVGLSTGVLSRDVFSAVVLMSITTALLAPAILMLLLREPVENRA